MAGDVAGIVLRRLASGGSRGDHKKGNIMRHRVHFASLLGTVHVVLLIFPGFFAGNNTALGDPDIVFVSRLLDSDPDSTLREAAVERATSGSMLARIGGVTRVLVDARLPGAPASVPIDVMDPDVSYDGTRIAFAGFDRTASTETETGGETGVGGAWRIYEIGVDGTGLRQVTVSDRQLDLSRYGAAARSLRGYDDFDPTYLPDGRLVFVSTRYPGVAPDGRQRATNLYVVNVDGTDLHRITTERFGGDTPSIDPTTGRIVYSRWWRSTRLASSSGSQAGPSPGYGGVRDDDPITSTSTASTSPSPATTNRPALQSVAAREFPGVNSWFLAEIDPDGTGMAMWTGFGLDRRLTQAYRPAMRADGSALALFIPRTPFPGLPRGDGLRRFVRGPIAPTLLDGPQEFSANRHPLQPESRLVYSSVAPLADGRNLVSAALVDDPLDYDIYIQSDDTDSPVPFFAVPGFAELDVVPFVSRPLPPVLVDETDKRHAEETPRTVLEAYSQGGSFTFLVENIFFNAPVDVDIANAPPVGQDLSIEFFMNPQRTSARGSDSPILIQRAKVPSDGKVRIELPAGVPLFEVLRGPNQSSSIPMGRDGQIFHVGGMNFGQTGGVGRCVGCHAGHSMLEVPEDPSWTNLAPSADTSASSTRRVVVPRDMPGGFREHLFTSDKLVDRRTQGFESQWSAAAEGDSFVRLTWPVALSAREVVLYGIRPGRGDFGINTQVIDGVEISTTLGGAVGETILVNEPLSPEGTRIALNEETPFNALRIRIPQGSISGVAQGRSGASLAEVEVIGRVADAAPSFVRGDTNCDSVLNVTDPIGVLDFLFLGSAELCCRAAADSNVTGELDIADAVHLLTFLFLGGPAPAAPFPECGEGVSGITSCAVSSCP